MFEYKFQDKTSAMTPIGIFQVPGSFTVGCNWWASHAGTAMWRDWQPTVVEADFARLAAAGLHSIRLFPLWTDFQPLNLHRGGRGTPREMRCGEGLLADHSGVDPLMLDRLVWTCQAAHRHGLKLIIGLVTGWMSGRLHIPEAILHLDPLTDPRSLIWQVRLIRAIVGRTLSERAVVAWDLGNECNCLGNAPTKEAAATWTAHISNAIRAMDNTRPVISGMHSLLPDDGYQVWTIQDQAEHCDILTTHPYPVFTPHCNQDRLDDPRTTTHATAETRLYADLGGKPACAEELGTLGPSIGDDAAAAAFVRVNLFSLWANDCRGLMWWCAFDQSHLEQTPYEWSAFERELGLFRADGSPRPLLAGFAELAKVRQIVAGCSRTADGILPPPRREAVCILSRGQDYWSVAWSAWILAKQAGFDLRFAWTGEPLPHATRYILPSVSGDDALYRRHWLDLLERVDAGAELLITHGAGHLSPFAQATGATLTQRRERRGPDEAVMIDGTRLPMTAGVDFHLTPAVGTEVLARNSTGAVVAVRAKHGRGQVTTWMFPVEHQLTTTRGSCDPGAAELHRIYEQWCDPLAAGRVVARTGAPWLALTEHELGANRRLVIAINHATSASNASLRLADGWRISKVLHGEAPQAGVLTVAAHDAAVIEVVC